MCLQVLQFSNKSVDLSLRVASLDYLGIVAARLRKDAVSSQLNEETISEILQEVSCLGTLFQLLPTLWKYKHSRTYPSESW